MTGSYGEAKTRRRKSTLHERQPHLHILSFFWHPKTDPSQDAFGGGAYRRFANVVSQFDKRDIDYYILENCPPVTSASPQHTVREYKIPFDERTYPAKLFARLFATLAMTILGIQSCRRRRYDLLLAPVGEEFCMIIPAYVTHLVTRIPWTAVVQNVPQAYAVLDQSGQLIVSLTQNYRHYRSLGIGAPNALMIASYSYFSKILFPKLYNRTKAIISVSRSLGLYLRSLGTRCDILIAGNGLDIEEISKTKTDCTKIYDGAFVGRFVPEKGIFDALKVWQIVAETFPKATLLLVGHADNVQMLAIKKTIDELGLSHNVIGLRSVSEKDKYALLKRSSLFLFLSKFESFGFAIAEALACGLPVVCYDMPYARELFSCPTVLKAPLGDLRSAASLVCSLLKDEGKRQALAETGIWFVRKFSWKEVAQIERQAYYSILTESS